MTEDEIRKITRRSYRHERKAAGEIVRMYEKAWRRVKSSLDSLSIEYEAASNPGVDWIYQSNRARNFKNQVFQALLAFSNFAEEKIYNGQEEAIKLAEEQAKRLTWMILGLASSDLTLDWKQIDESNVRAILKILREGDRLHRLFESISRESSEAAEDSLIRGILLGQNPRKVAREIRQILGTTLSKALTISRTETLRAHREATKESYLLNDDIIDGWLWHSTLDSRTCATCWLMHGTKHDVDESMQEHPNGRCAMIPITKTWEQIGRSHGVDFSEIQETRLTVPLGTSLFEELPSEQQIDLLGPSRWLALKSHEITLSELLTTSHSDVWGDHKCLKSLKELFADTEKLEYYQKAGHLQFNGHSLKELQILAKETDDKISDILGRPLSWNGSVGLRLPTSLEEPLGSFSWDGTIWITPDADMHSLIHELLHTHSVGLSQKTYVLYPRVEEAVVEGLTRTIGPEVAADYQYIFPYYDSLVESLEEIRITLGSSRLAFYTQLIQTPLLSRIQFLSEKLNRLRTDSPEEKLQARRMSSIVRELIIPEEQL